MDKILYEESRGAGRDDESSTQADGIWVRLSKWDSDRSAQSFPSMPRHYILETTVMIDRKWVVDHKRSIFPKSFVSDSIFIRDAIREMDKLLLEYPQVIDGETS